MPGVLVRGRLVRGGLVRGVLLRVLGVALTVLVAVGAGLLVPERESGDATAGTGSGSPRAPGPQVTQAVGVARTEYGLLAGGGWAPAWELWSSGAKQAVAQADFVRLNTECRPVLGVPYVIDEGALVAAGRVRVAWRRGPESGVDAVVFEGGEWRFMPDPGTLAEFGSGVEAAVRARRAAGVCR